MELVLTEACADEGGQRLEAAGDQPEDVEGRLVGPVHVFEDEDPGLVTGELVDETRSHIVRAGPVYESTLQRAAELLSYLEEGPERPGREQWVAGAPGDTRGERVLVAESPDHRGLPTPGLAGDDDHLPAPARCFGKCVAQRVQGGFALQERCARLHGKDRHRPMVEPRAVDCNPDRTPSSCRRRGMA